MDTTAWGIAAGAVGTAAFAVLKAFRHKTFDLENSVVVFLGLFALLTGAELLKVALLGEEADLPHTWRQYLAVAAIVAIGLSANYLTRAFRSVLQRTVVAASEDESLSGEGPRESEKCKSANGVSSDGEIGE